MRASSSACRPVAGGLIDLRTAALLACALGASPAAAQVRTFYLDPRPGNNQVTCLSEAPLEDFAAVCNRVTGEMGVDPADFASFRGAFRLRVEDLRTGIELRDKIMRSAEWLDASNAPEIIVQIERLEGVAPQPAAAADRGATTTVRGTLIGTCTIRGKTLPLRAAASLAYLPETPVTQRRTKGDLLRVRTEFDVKPADYGVAGGAGGDTIGLKVAETLRIRATVFGTTEKPAQALQAERIVVGEADDVPAPPPPPKSP